MSNIVSLTSSKFYDIKLLIESNYRFWMKFLVQQLFFLIRILIYKIIYLLLDLSTLLYRVDIENKKISYFLAKNHAIIEESFLILFYNDMAKPSSWIIPKTLYDLAREKRWKKKKCKKSSFHWLRPATWNFPTAADFDDKNLVSAEEAWLRLEERYCLVGWRNVEKVKIAILHKKKFDSMNLIECKQLLADFLVEDRTDPLALLTSRQRRKLFRNVEAEDYVDINDAAYWRKFIKKFFLDKQFSATITTTKHKELERLFYLMFKEW